MDNMTPRFSVPDVPTNDPALDREASEQKSRERDIAQYATWMSGKWAALRQNADIMGIMSCGPRAVAGMVGMMMSDMGARLDDVALVTADLVLVEIPREALPMVDEFKRRALRAALMTDAGRADAIADCISDITRLAQRFEQFEREHNDAITDIQTDIGNVAERVGEFETAIKEAGTQEAGHGL